MSAFTLVELLVALAITAILLTAVAVAFNASIINYRENEDMFKAINTARQALFRITTQIRTGLVDPNDIASTDRCTVLCADGSKVTYRYDDSPDNTLSLHDDGTGSDYVLCENVAAMTFTKTPTDDGLDCKSVQISIAVGSGSAQRKLAAAAVVRRNLP